jgi:hypothetical protein
MSSGRIASVTIGGSIIAGLDNSSNASIIGNASINAGRDIGSITVRGDVVGSVGSGGDVTKVIFSAVGQASPTATSDLAIGKITIGGRVEHAQILAGYDKVVAKNGNAQIGAVRVGGDWIASDLVAGVLDGGVAGFGDAGDTIIGGGASIAKIASIIIGGIVEGTAAGGDLFAFTSHAIGSFKFSATNVPVPAAPGTVTLSEITGSDVVLHVV